MVGKDQAIGRDKAAAAAVVETDAAEAHFFEEGVGEIKAVFGLNGSAGELINEPNSVVGEQNICCERGREGEKEKAEV